MNKNNDPMGPCRDCGAYGTIVQMGLCCSVIARQEADRVFNALGRQEQRRVLRSQQVDKGTAK